MMNLVDANRRRAAIFAEAVVKRLPDAGLWYRYTADEGLEGELRAAPDYKFLHYQRPGYPQAVLVFDAPVMHDIKKVDWGEPVVVESNVVERYTGHFQNDTDAIYDESVEHTFSATRSLLDAAKVGAELEIKASLSADYAGVKGGLEVSEKITAEYSHQWGEQSTHSDTITRSLHIPAHTRVDFEVVRSVDKTQRQISARTDFEFSRVGFIDETGAGERPPSIFLNWASWTEFLAVGQGLADTSKALYREFINDRLTEAELEALTAPSEEVVSWLAEYDNVVEQDIKIL